MNAAAWRPPTKGSSCHLVFVKTRLASASSCNQLFLGSAAVTQGLLSWNNKEAFACRQRWKSLLGGCALTFDTQNVTLVGGGSSLVQVDLGNKKKRRCSQASCRFLVWFFGCGLNACRDQANERSLVSCCLHLLFSHEMIRNS